MQENLLCKFDWSSASGWIFNDGPEQSGITVENPNTDKLSDASCAVYRKQAGKLTPPHAKLLFLCPKLH